MSSAPSFVRLLLLVGLVAGVGCSGPLVRNAPDLGAPAEFPNHTAEQIVGLMAALAQSDSLVAYSSQAKLEIRSPERNADVSATIRQRAADTLWSSVRGPLGIEVARARATPDSFAVHDKLNGRLYLGSVAAASEFLPAPVSAAELFASLLGVLRPEPGPTWTVRAVERGYVLTDAATERVFTVDPSVWRTTRYQAFDAGVLVDERTFSAFDTVDDRILPRRVELRNPLDGVLLRIEHQKLTLNPATLEFPFSPGDATIRRLD